MKLYISTPILRAVVRNLNILDTKLAMTIVKADHYIKNSPFLREVFGSDVVYERDRIKSFLRKDLIESTIKECTAKERAKSLLPNPSNIGQLLQIQK